MPGKYCCVQGCHNTTRHTRSRAFFSLPTGEERRREWLTAIGREDLLRRKYLKFKSFEVCDAHFEQSSFRIIKRLKDDAMPTRRLPGGARPPARASPPAVPASQQDDHDDQSHLLLTIDHPAQFQGEDGGAVGEADTEAEQPEIKMEIKFEPDDDDEPARSPPAGSPPPPATQTPCRPPRKRKIEVWVPKAEK